MSNLMDTIFGVGAGLLGGVGGTAIAGAIDPKSIASGITTDMIAGTTAATIASLGSAAPAAGAADAAAVPIGAAAGDAIGGAAADTGATAVGGAATDAAATGADVAGSAAADTATTSAEGASDIAAQTAATPASQTTDVSTTASNIAKGIKAAGGVESSVQKAVNYAQQENAQNKIGQQSSASPESSSTGTSPQLQSPGIGSNVSGNSMMNTIFGSPEPINNPTIENQSPQLSPINQSASAPPMIQPPPLITSDRNLKTNIKKADNTVKNFLQLISRNF